MTAISHLVREPDWLMLKCLPPLPCAEAIQTILKALEGTEQAVYAMRGEALRIFDERELYREFHDPHTHQPCSGTYRWLQIYLPDSARYCQEALVNRQKLFEIPLEIAAHIPRVNLKQLEKADEKVRALPDVLDAAKVMTEKQFTAKLSTDYHQHLEPMETLRFKYPAGDAETVRKALAEVGRRCGLEDMAGQLLAWAIDYLAEMEEEVTA